MNPIDESVEQLIEAWKLFVGRMPQGVVTRSDGVVTALSHVELPFLNLCTHDSPLADPDDLRRRVGLAVDRAADCRFPWMFGLCEDWAPDGWQDVVAERGLAPAMEIVGMTTDGMKPPRRPLPQLEYRRVRDVAGARTVAELNMHAYGMPLELGECISNLHLWHDDSYGYVGYVDGRPVTCSATFPVAGTVYVAFVATHPDEHRKGYAEAVMRHSIERGAAGMGLGRLALHASEAGFPLYEAMGFEAGPRFSLLTTPHEEG